MNDVERSVRSPNFDPIEIPVKYVVLHYTGGQLPAAIRIFSDRATGVSTHLLIDVSGCVYELVDCLSGTAYRAHHAGSSRWLQGGNLLEGFNDFSIGIELVNPNGNLLPYSDAQYRSLRNVLHHLMSIYPALQSPARVLGHEQISGWRGKADPGRLFDWGRFFSSVYPDKDAPVRKYRCPDSLACALKAFLGLVPDDHEDRFWHALSHLTETVVSLITDGSD